MPNTQAKAKWLLHAKKEFIRAIRLTEENIMDIFDMMEALGKHPNISTDQNHLFFTNQRDWYTHGASIGTWIVRDWDDFCFSIDDRTFNKRYVAHTRTDVP